LNLHWKLVLNSVVKISQSYKTLATLVCPKLSPKIELSTSNISAAFWGCWCCCWWYVSSENLSGRHRWLS